MSITQSDEGLPLGNAAKSGHKPAAKIHNTNAKEKQK